MSFLFQLLLVSKHKNSFCQLISCRRYFFFDNKRQILQKILILGKGEFFWICNLIKAICPCLNCRLRIEIGNHTPKMLVIGNNRVVLEVPPKSCLAINGNIRVHQLHIVFPLEKEVGLCTLIALEAHICFQCDLDGLPIHKHLPFPKKNLLIFFFLITNIPCKRSVLSAMTSVFHPK